MFGSWKNWEMIQWKEYREKNGRKMKYRLEKRNERKKKKSEGNKK